MCCTRVPLVKCHCVDGHIHQFTLLLLRPWLMHTVQHRKMRGPSLIFQRKRSSWSSQDECRFLSNPQRPKCTASKPYSAATPSEKNWKPMLLKILHVLFFLSISLDVSETKLQTMIHTAVSFPKKLCIRSFDLTVFSVATPQSFLMVLLACCWIFYLKPYLLEQRFLVLIF